MNNEKIGVDRIASAAHDKRSMATPTQELALNCMAKFAWERELHEGVGRARTMLMQRKGDQEMVA